MISLDGSLRWKRTWQAGRLLIRALGSRSGDGRSALRCVTEEGTEYDLYEPANASRQTIILLYGLDLTGERNARVVQLAWAYADSGFRVAVPCLTGFKSFRIDLKDKRAITDLVVCLHCLYGGRIGITGFSAGAGMALVVAADPLVAEWIDPLLLFGPYDCLSKLWAQWQACDTPMSNGHKDWDCFLWIQMVSAYRHRDALDIAPDQKRELVELLRDYCTDASLRRKRAFYERVLQGRNPLARNDPLPDARTLGVLSPHGHMHHIRSRVLILHDANDRLIPPDHSERILDELRQHRDPRAQQLLITPLLSHVSLGSLWRILDLFRITRLVGHVFDSPHQ